MSAELVHELEQSKPKALTRRARAVSSLGPATSLGGIVWALAQPYRITLLHPHGQGFWWLVAEPPLLVVAIGIAFHVLVVRGLLDDLEEAER
jgi:hypothetical protein